MGQSQGVILFQSGFYSGGEGPARGFGSWERPTSRAGPPRSRYCLSHFPSRSTTSNRIGPMRARKTLCASARFASRIPSSVMDAGANRRTTSATIGSGFAAFFATSAVKHSHFCRRFLRPTAITASSLAARRYSATSWKAMAGKPPHPPSKTRIAWRIPPLCAPMVSQSGFLSTAVFVSAPDDAGHKCLAGQDGVARSSFAAPAPAYRVPVSRALLASANLEKSRRRPPSLPGNTTGFRLLSTRRRKQHHGRESGAAQATYSAAGLLAAPQLESLVVPALARSSSVCALYTKRLVLPSTSTPLRICSTATAAAAVAT